MAKEAKTLDDLIEFLEDIRDEYPDSRDQTIMIQNDHGDCEGFLLDWDVEPSNVWLIFEEVEV